MEAQSGWFHIYNEDEVLSPSVLIYPDRVRENIRKMLVIADGPHRLRPHVKTHKLPPIVRFQLEEGLTRFKCATLSELEMTAGSGGEDVLLAYSLIGPAVDKFLGLMTAYPDTHMSLLTDSLVACQQIERKAEARDMPVTLYLDINNGMGRTGITPGQEAFDLYKYIRESNSLAAGGLHIYDGHIHTRDFHERKAECDRAFASVAELIKNLESAGMDIPEIVCGGTPTFPVHALYEERMLSPGTSLLWDYGYGTSFPDLNFLHAAVLFTRVISKPGPNTICLDLGHKAVASEKPHPRVWFPEMEEYTPVNHSEEHLTVTGDAAARYSVGDCLYGIPTHICPTMALHEQVYVVRDRRVIGKWTVTARSRLY